MHPKSNGSEGILATFAYLDDFRAALKKAQAHPGCKGCEGYSPTSYHELMDDAEKVYGRSEVRWFTTIGGVTGLVTGFATPLLLDWDWPLVVGGKTAGMYSLPAYFVFGFEFMILFGALATILGMLVMGRMPNPNVRIRHVRITDDRFAIYVPGASLGGEQARLMKECGADEVIAN